MSTEVKKEIALEIAHVLFIDIVGYSKLLSDKQRELFHLLNNVVSGTAPFRAVETTGKLVCLPTGDGMVLAFFTTVDAPVRCAQEVSRKLSEYPQLLVRMGINSGPVDEVRDVNNRPNVTGAGINLAQRVMDCGDAGHILLSKRVADDLGQYEEWQPYLHELGPVEAKHGVRVEVVNFYNDEVGNAELPEKFKQAAHATRLAVRRKRKKVLAGAAALVAIGSGVGLWAFFHQSFWRSLPVSDKSIAVLPFSNLSDEKENAYFADGVQDEILTDLARIADLKVISRTSVMPYKAGSPRNLREIAQQLGVAHILEGSVQRAAGKVRVNAQLIDARTDKQLWGQVYDRNLADVFAIQSEIAKAIADQLQAKLSPHEEKAIERRPTSDIAAFDLYTRAKNILLVEGDRTEAELLQAVDLLNQTVARDPSFFDAYCQLAYAHDWLYFIGHDHTPERLALAEAAIRSAVRLRPDAAETHLARAQNLYWGYREYDGALAEVEVARQTLPNDPRIFRLTALLQKRQGHWQESTRNVERAVELDPRNVSRLLDTAKYYSLHLRRYAEAEALLDRVLVLAPDNLDAKLLRGDIEAASKADLRPALQIIDLIRTTNPAALSSIADYWLWVALAQRDVAAAENALTAAGNNPIGLIGEVFFNRAFIEGVIARMTKDEAKARSAFVAARAEQEKIVQAQPNESRALCALGLIDAGLGRKEDALREGRRAIELLPVEKDAVTGVFMIQYLGLIAAWVGDKDLAFKHLETVVRLPGNGLDYGDLKLDPLWDPLRDDPRFEKIVEEAKKPVALE